MNGARGQYEAWPNDAVCILLQFNFERNRKQEKKKQPNLKWTELNRVRRMVCTTSNHSQYVMHTNQLLG